MSYRLPAELIRDSALKLAGLLDPAVGGPSVKTGDFGHKSGDDQSREVDPVSLRRALYTYIQRTAPPPFLLTFDATSRERCIVQREITNTPLQSLILLNDSLFNLAARQMARNEISNRELSPTTRLQRLFRKAMSRRASDEETAALERFYHSQLERFEADLEAATIYLNIAEDSANTAENTPQWAAMSAVANAILSLDETITKR